MSSYGLFVTMNGGKSWVRVNALPSQAVRDVVVDSQSPNALYVGAAAGIFKSIDQGLSWALANTGIREHGVNGRQQGRPEHDLRRYRCGHLQARGQQVDRLHLCDLLGTRAARTGMCYRVSGSTEKPSALAAVRSRSSRHTNPTSRGFSSHEMRAAANCSASAARSG